MTAGQFPELMESARSGDRRALARLLSLIEDGVVVPSLGPAGETWSTGITGAPGTGKSTLTDGLISLLRTDAGVEVAVLAVDPSSPFTGGAILGDRVRMQAHQDDPGVYIRSLATRGHLGGLVAEAPKLVEALAAAGFVEVLIETVGVGQVEVEIASIAATTVVVVNPGWGDGIQASKAGILEIGDVFVVNKSDRPGVEAVVRDLTQMLELATSAGWQPPVVTTVATENVGLEELFGAIKEHRRYLTDAA